LSKLLHMVVTDHKSSGAIYFEFDRLAHKAKSDYTLYKRNWHEIGTKPGTSEFGQIVVEALMRDNTGVGAVEVRSYVVQAHGISGAVSSSVIIYAVKNALRKHGYTLVEQPRELGSPYLDLRVSQLDSPRLVAIVLWQSTLRVIRELGRSIVLGLKKVPGMIGRHLPASLRNFLQI